MGMKSLAYMIPLGDWDCVGKMGPKILGIDESLIKDVYNQKTAHSQR